MFGSEENSAAGHQAIRALDYMEARALFWLANLGGFRPRNQRFYDFAEMANKRDKPVRPFDWFDMPFSDQEFLEREAVQFARALEVANLEDARGSSYAEVAMKLVSEGVVSAISTTASKGTLRWREVKLKPFGARYYFSP
jgi:hypothetical protein